MLIHIAGSQGQGMGLSCNSVDILFDNGLAHKAGQCSTSSHMICLVPPEECSWHEECNTTSVLLPCLYFSSEDFVLLFGGSGAYTSRFATCQGCAWARTARTSLRDRPRIASETTYETDWLMLCN